MRPSPLCGFSYAMEADTLTRFPCPSAVLLFQRPELDLEEEEAARPS